MIAVGGRTQEMSKVAVQCGRGGDKFSVRAISTEQFITASNALKHGRRTSD